MKSKKGIFLNEGMTIVLVVIIIGLIIMMLLIFSGSTEKSKKEEATRELASLNHNVMLMNYLSIPVKGRPDIPSNIDNIADLIILAIEDENIYLPKLEAATNEILTPFFGSPRVWVVDVLEGDNEIISMYHPNYKILQVYSTIYSNEQKIPYKNTKTYTVKLRVREELI